jgi:hypothetical protein
MTRPTAEQAGVEKPFPTVARWVPDGHTEVGDQEGAGFVARALDHGGLASEGDRPRTLAEALPAAGRGPRLHRPRGREHLPAGAGGEV